MIFGYQSARDFFEAVRCAAQELERTERQLQRMMLAEGVKAQRYGIAGSGGGDVHGMAATDARMDFEGRMRRRMHDDALLVSYGVEICYGQESGVGSLAGSIAADSLYWRYCRGMSWKRVAEEVHVSVRTAQRWSAVAIDVIDGIGFSRIIAGIGIAEE